jgi:hypothetical protein
MLSDQPGRGHAQALGSDTIAPGTSAPEAHTTEVTADKPRHHLFCLM